MSMFPVAALVISMLCRMVVEAEDVAQWITTPVAQN